MGSSGAWRVATRRSALARAQAGVVATALATETGRPAELVPLSTTGDDQPTRAVGTFDVKGLFVDGVRAAVLDGRADLVVHSYKDLPTDPRRGLMIVAVPEREDPRDVLVTRDGAHLTTLRRGATVGISSARRAAQVQRARRDVIVQPLRGNLDTRLRRVADGDLDAVVVALAGLRRLGPVDLPLKLLPLEHGECLHAPAQGALAIECRADDGATIEALRVLDHDPTRMCVRAERALMTRLEGGCTAPIGAHANLLEGGRLELLGMIADPIGTRLHRGSHHAAADQPERLGHVLAESLLAMGGEAIVARLRAARAAAPTR